MRSYQPNDPAKPQQQSSIEEQSTKKDSSSTDIHATNNQMRGQGIQTDVIFFSKPQAAASQVKSLDDVNLIMKLIPPILSPKKSSQNSCLFAIKTSSLWRT